MKLVKMKRNVKNIKRPKVKDDAMSTAERYLGYMSKNLASVQNNALFIAGQMKNWPNEDDRFDVRTSMMHIRDLAESVVDSLNKAIKMI